MQIKIREMHALFAKLQMETRRGKHHDHAYLIVKERVVVRTRVSHGKGDIPMADFYQILQQFHINTEQFRGLKDCSLDMPRVS